MEQNLGTTPEKQTLERLLETALRRFSQNGYDGVSVQDIAQASSVTKPTLYYYFVNKEGLYRQVANQAVNQLRQLISSHTDFGESATMRATNLLRRFQTLCRTHVDLMRFVFYLHTPSNRAIEGFDPDGFLSMLKSLIGEICTFALSRGELTADRIRPAEILLLALFRSSICGYLIEGSVAGASKFLSHEEDEGAIRFIFAR